jgi:hypothetical protein
MLVHSKNACGDLNEGCGLLAFSRNGTYNWLAAQRHAFATTMQWATGQSEQLQMRQRPKILFDPVDKVTPLFMFNGVRRRSGGHRFIHTMAVSSGGGG